MPDGILVVNAGSSSLKFSLYEVVAPATPPRPLVRAMVEEIGTSALFIHDGEKRPAPAARDHVGAIAHVLDWIGSRFPGIRPVAAGHRVVHGGPDFSAPVRVDPGILSALEALIPLAPLHLPHNVAAIRALAAAHPALPQVACFDTAFHAGQPDVASRFALPAEFAERGIRRYGFHGLSFEAIVRDLPGVMASTADGATLPERLIVAHLGNGASLCAIRAGRSVASTMGFSTLDGIPMGTRPGAIDPGVLLHLLQREEMDVAGLTELLYRRSGLLGLSGISSDMRALLASDDPRAAFAVAYHAYHVARAAGSLAVALGGLDALVFTGGIGEHAAPVRAAIAAHLGWLGLALDRAANEHHGPRISRPASTISAWVVPTDEEGVIVGHARALLNL